jgi:hypothetical protein
MNTSRFLRVAFSLIFLLWTAIEISAQKPTPTPERNREVVALINDARLAAPELTLDTLLRVVEAKKVVDPVWRKEILDEVGRTIDDAQYPVAMRPAFGGAVERNNLLLDTEAWVLAMAHGAKMNRLSFKARWIAQLLASEPERAKQMISQMNGQLGLKPRTCEDALSYWAGDIYPVVANVSKTVFTEDQIRQGHRALFAVSWIENIESPGQIYPAFELVQQLQGSPAERQMMYAAAAKAINRSFNDDRSFTYMWDAIKSRIGKLTEGEPDPLKNELKQAYRGMLAKNLRTTRCKDNEIPKGELPDYVENANKLLGDKPLTIEDIAPTELAGTPKLTHILQKSSLTRKMKEELLIVRDTKIVDNKAVDRDPNDIEWAAKVNEFVDRALSAEGSDGETEGELLFIKAAMLGGMLSGIGPSDLRKSIVRRHLRLLANSRLQKTSFIEWHQWIQDARRWAPDSFDEIAAEFPNPNLKVMLAAKRLLSPPETVKPSLVPAKGQ